MSKKVILKCLKCDEVVVVVSTEREEILGCLCLLCQTGCKDAEGEEKA